MAKKRGVVLTTNRRPGGHGGAPPVVVKHKSQAQRGQEIGFLPAERERNMRRKALFQTILEHAGDTSGLARNNAFLASTPDPHRYYTKAQIRRDPRLQLLLQNRRAAIAQTRSDKLDRTNVQKTQALLGYTHLPGAQKLGQTIGLLGMDAAYSPAGAYYMATHDPRKTVPELARATAYPWLHPRAAFKNHPDQLVLAALAGTNTGIAAAAKAAAMRGAAAEGAGVGGVLKAGLKHTGGGTRTIYKPGTDQATTALNYNTAMGPFLGRLSDRIMRNRHPDVQARKGKVVQEAQYGPETQHLPNPEHRTAAQARQAAHEELRAARAQVEQANKYGASKVVARERTPERVQARIDQIDAELNPLFENAAKALGQQAKAEGGKHVFRGRKEGFVPGSDFGAELWKSNWAKEQNKRLGYGPGDSRRLTPQDAPEPWNETNQHLKGGGDLRGEAQRQVVAGLEKVAAGGGQHAAKARDLLLKLQERDSLSALLVKHEGAALFPEEAPAGLGVDMRPHPMGARAATTREAATSRLTAAEQAARDAEAAAAQVPETVPITRNRLISPEVRAPTAADRLGAVLDRPRNWAGGRKFASEKMQNERVALERRYATMTDDQIRAELTQSNLSKSALQRVLRFTNRGQRMLLLYSKLGYIPSNVISQEVMSLVHQGLWMPANRAQQAMLRDTRVGAGLRAMLGKHGTEALPENYRRLAMMISGLGRTVAGEYKAGTEEGSALTAGATKVEGLLGGTDQAIGNAFGKIVDDPYRFAAVLHELRRMGISPKQLSAFFHEVDKFTRHGDQAKFHDPAGIRKSLVDKADEASRRGGRAVVDYGRMGKGAQTLRDIVFILPWVKGAFHYTTQFPFEHPYQANALAGLADVGKKHTGLSNHMPSFLQGSFKVGEQNTPVGKMPLIVNPRYVNTLTQPFDTAAAMLTFVSDVPGMPEAWRVRGNKYRSITDVLQPVFGDALDQYSKEGALTAGGIGAQIKQSAPIYGLIHGVMHPASAGSTFKLHPRNQWEVIANWVFGSPTPKPMNPVTRESIYRAEQTAGLSKKEAEVLHSKWFLQDLEKKSVLIHGRPLTADEHRWFREAVQLTQVHALAKIEVAAKYPQFVQRGKKTSLDTRGQLLAAIIAMNKGKPGYSEKVAGAVKWLETKDPNFNARQAEYSTATDTAGTEKQIRDTVKQFNEATRNRPYTEGGNTLTMPK